MKDKPKAAVADTAEQKVWGWIREAYRNDKYRLVDCFAVANGFCSLHRHDFQSNTFLVKSGRLRVILYEDPGAKASNTITLDKARTTFTVPAGIRHRFECLADCEFAELYVGFFGKAPDDQDIVREDTGGIRVRS